MIRSHSVRATQSAPPTAPAAGFEYARFEECLPLLALILAILVSPFVYDLAVTLGLAH